MTATFVRRLFLGWVALALGAVGAAHEVTRSAHEASLDPREARRIAAAGLRTAEAEPVAESATCRLTLRLVETDSGQPAAGLVRVTRENGRTVPLAGLVNRGIKLRNDHPAKDWFVVTEASEIRVPGAKLTIEAISGLTSDLTRIDLDLSGKKEARVDVSLRRFADPRMQGWWGGNTHLHLNSLTREQADEYLRTIPRGDQLDLLFVSHLERVDADRTYITNSYSLAELEKLGRPDVVFGNGEEHRHNFAGNSEGYGHVMFLNIRQLVQPVSVGATITGRGPDWPPLRPGIVQARGQGATVIWCHNTFGHEDTPDWLAGLVDAHNIFDGGSHGGYADTFYRYLNIGLRVPFSTGTDWFLYDFARVYARVEGGITVPKWLAAVAAGRTFITNGPLLEFHAADRQVGDTIALTRPGTLPVSGRAQGRQDFGALEIVHNGKVVHRAASRRVGDHHEAEIRYTLEVDEPGWVALRIPGGTMEGTSDAVLPPNLPAIGDTPKNEMGVASFAHTSPIYLELAGRRIFKAEAARALVDDMAAAEKAIREKAKFDHDTQREDVLKIYRDGIAQLRKQLGQ